MDQQLRCFRHLWDFKFRCAAFQFWDSDLQQLCPPHLHSAASAMRREGRTLQIENFRVTAIFALRRQPALKKRTDSLARTNVEIRMRARRVAHTR